MDMTKIICIPIIYLNLFSICELCLKWKKENRSTHFYPEHKTFLTRILLGIKCVSISVNIKKRVDSHVS